MENQEQLLSEALQKAVQVVDTIEERYREAAFPIVLQALLGTSTNQNVPGANYQESNGFSTPKPALSPTLSVNEFFHRVNAETHTARFVTAAYYLLHTGKAEQFTQVDILEIYRKLRQPQPKNPADVMSQCIRKAHIIDAPSNGDKQKYWVISSEGEKFVEGLLRDHASSSNTVVG
ncbi:MAG: hypothetical protein E6J34_17845 [Chloroflexi bacterium]|nr:MAG: hypothetical protein E6J34_17845 [Chloroflexota bacterium]